MLVCLGVCFVICKTKGVTLLFLHELLEIESLLKTQNKKIHTAHCVLGSDSARGKRTTTTAQMQCFVKEREREKGSLLLLLVFAFSNFAPLLQSMNQLLTLALFYQLASFDVLFHRACRIPSKHMTSPHVKSMFHEQ